MLNARCGIHHIAKYIAILHQTEAVMETNADVDLIDFIPALAVVDQSALHVRGGFDGAHAILKLSKNCVANGFDDPAALGLDDRKQNAVVAVDHGHVFDVAFFLGIRRRSLDVAEKNRHRRPQLLELLLGLGARFQQFLEFVLIHDQNDQELYNKRNFEICPESAVDAGITGKSLP